METIKDLYIRQLEAQTQNITTNAVSQMATATTRTMTSVR